MDTNLVVEGIKFMFLGMGTVFVFLTIMIIMMNLMSYIIHKLFPEPASKLSGEETKTNNSNSKIVAAITAAIMHHRQG